MVHSLVQGGSMVSGSAGQKGAIGASSHLQKCSSPVGTVALNFDDRYYSSWYYRYNLPKSPIPLVRLMLQQSNCFTVVDRSRGLRAVKEELSLQEQGLLRKGSGIRKGQLVAADYTITPNIIFSEKNAGGVGGSASNYFGKWGRWAGRLAGNAKFRQAQTYLELIDNRSGVQTAAAEGSAQQTDLGASANFFRGFGASVGGWQNTNEGKLISAALLDALNKLVTQVR